MNRLLAFALLLWVSLPISALQASLSITRDVRYATSAGTPASLQSLDIYAPSGVAAAPVVVLVHGGGWQGGSKTNEGFLVNKVAYFSARGFVTVSINYRLSPAIVHPAHVDDVATAIAWVRRKIAAHGGDPERVFLLGHSAGAHLVALAATDESRLAAQGETLLAIKGVIVLDTASFDISTRYSGVVGEDTENTPAILAQAFGTEPFGHRDASPQVHVAPGKSVPPFLLCYVASRLDSQIATQSFAGALDSAGIGNTLLAGQGYTHETINTTFGLDGEQTTNAANLFLDARLAELAPQIDARHSGVWFNPTRSGEGLQFEFSRTAAGQPVAVVTWFTYDLEGRPLYLGGSAIYASGATQVRVTLFSTAGAMFGAAFDPSRVQLLPWGEVDLSFPDCTSARVNYRALEPAFGSGELQLVRIVAPVLGACAL